MIITPELGFVSSASSRIRPSGFSSWRESVLVVVVGVGDDMRRVVDAVVDFAILIGEYRDEGSNASLFNCLAEVDDGRTKNACVVCKDAAAAEQAATMAT